MTDDEMNKIASYFGITLQPKCAQVFDSSMTSERARRIQLAQQWMRELKTFPRHLFLGSSVLVPPLIFFLLPLKSSLTLVIISVVALVVVPPLIKKISPVLYELLDRSIAAEIDRSWLLKSFKEFITHMKPFILWALFLCGPVLMMFSHVLNKVWLPGKQLTDDNALTTGVSLRIRQNLPAEPKGHDDNFMGTSAFTVTAAVLFLSGLPAIATFAFYNFLGVDHILGFPSANPQFFQLFFGILLYAYSVGWCLTTLFFKAYFTYPLTFTSMERFLEVDKFGIRTSHIKGWFSQAAWFTNPDCWPKEIKWTNIRSIEYYQAGVGAMTPLPATLIAKSSPIYRVMNKLAGFTDAVVQMQKPATYLCINEHASHTGAMTRGIRVNLWELKPEERAKLYYALRSGAPDAVFSQAAIEHLIGSTRLQDSRYNKLWLDILASEQSLLNTNHLHSECSLKNGDYRITEKLGSIGQANLYAAVDSDGQEVTVKEYILCSGNGLNNLIESTAQFENETSLLSQMCDERIPKLLDMFFENQRLYSVQERLLKRTLREFISDEGPLNQAKALSLSLQLCEILRYIHNLPDPIVHRSFTPDNLILSESGLLSLIDFSASRHAGVGKTDECAGHHCYTAPEQFRGELNTQSDIYALGATIYFLLTGQDPPPITMLSLVGSGAKIDAELDAIVGRCTALDLANRYESSDWIEMDLKSAIESENRVLST